MSVGYFKAKLASIKKAELEKKESSKPFHGYNKKKHSRSGGLSDSYRKKYNRETGSNLKRPVTGEVKAGSKAAKRRKSFCARMSGVKGPTSKEGKLTPKGAALKRWKCSKSEYFLAKLESLSKVSRADVSKSHILMFPVTINGMKSDPHEDLPDYHVTLKWMGENPHKSPEEIQNIVDKHGLTPPENFELHPHIFHTPNGPAHVLLLKGNLGTLHNAKKDIDKGNPDRYPSYMPHITISKKMHDDIMSGAVNLKDLNIQVHPLEYRIGEHVVQKFHPQSEKLASSEKIHKADEEKPKMQSHVYFNGFEPVKTLSHPGGWAQYHFTKEDLANILNNWDNVADWQEKTKMADRKNKGYHPTAIKRPTTPAPIRTYVDNVPDDTKNKNILYHGVGQDEMGRSAISRGGKHNVIGYDPYHANPEMRVLPNNLFDEIHSHYTLNVVPKEIGRNILQEIHDRLKPEGKAIISVRRDLDKSPSKKIADAVKAKKTIKKSEDSGNNKSELTKALTPEEMNAQGYKFKILKPSKAREAYAVTVHHKGKKVGHLVFSKDPRLGSREDNAHQKGFHDVYKAHIEPEHRGKGLYQRMLNIGAEHVKSMGGKGLFSEGFQRSGDATKAWDKVASFAVDPGKGSVKSLPYRADYFIQKSEQLKKMPKVFTGTKKKPYKTVWRVENEQGQGPYDADIPALEFHGSWDLAERTPMPEDDEGFSEKDLSRLNRPSSDLNPNVRFGFESKEHAKNWFTPEELKEMSSFGFKLKPVKAKNIWSSGKQAFFERYIAPKRKSKKQK